MATATPPNPGETNAEQPTPSAAPQASQPSNALEAPAPALQVPASPAPASAPAGDPDDLVETARTPTVGGWRGQLEQVQSLRSRYPLAEMALFFFLGFIYDVATLGRIDDKMTIVQQAGYLLVLGGLLLLEHRFPEGTEPPKLLARVWSFREDAIHFFLGSLLSSFMLFYFKSASGLMSFVFLVVLFGLLVANELPRFRAFGPMVRVGLFSLCVSSYFAYVLPVTLGRIGFGMFLLAALLGCASIFGLIYIMRRWTQDESQLRWRVAAPGFGVQGVMVLLYLLRVIPPIPLSVTYSGIYHEVRGERGAHGKEYHLSYEGRWWKPWQHGDQDFLQRAGDKAWYFVRVFAPAGFDFSKNPLFVHWYYDDPKKGWVEYYKYRLKVDSNGTEWGFRTNANLSVKPGDWRAVLATESGHEINRLSFEVEEDTRTEPRAYDVEVSVLARPKPVPLEDLEKVRADIQAEKDKARKKK